MRRSSLYFLILLSLSACFAPHSVSPTLHVNTSPSAAGHNRGVAVAIEDARAEKTVIGYWGKPGSKDAPISLSASPSPALMRALNEGLTAKGFAVFSNGNPRRLNVTLRNLTYENRYDDIWRITLRIETTLHAVVLSEKGKILHEQDYSSRTEKRLLRAPSMESNQKYVSVTLSDAVNMLLANQTLIDALAR